MHKYCCSLVPKVTIISFTHDAFNLQELSYTKLSWDKFKLELEDEEFSILNTHTKKQIIVSQRKTFWTFFTLVTWNLIRPIRVKAISPQTVIVFSNGVYRFLHGFEKLYFWLSCVIRTRLMLVKIITIKYCKKKPKTPRLLGIPRVRNVMDFSGAKDRKRAGVVGCGKKAKNSIGFRAETDRLIGLGVSWSRYDCARLGGTHSKNKFRQTAFN